MVRKQRSRNNAAANAGGLPWRLAMAALVVAAVGRAVYLAKVDGPLVRGVGAAGFAGATQTGTADDATKQVGKLDDELANLYAICPMAAVVDFQTVSNSPTEAAAVLTTYESAAGNTAGATGFASADSVAPRPLFGPPGATGSASASPGVPPPVRLAQLPPALWPTARVATKEADLGPRPSRGDWLVDPNEWFTPEERERQNPPATTPAEPPSTPATSPVPAEPVEPKPVPPTQPEPTAAPPVVPSPVTEAIPDATPTAVPPQPITPPFTAPPLPAPVAQHVAPLATPPFTAPPTVVAPGPPAQQVAPPFAAPPVPAAVQPAGAGSTGPVDPHLELFAKNAYPSARECATCHEDIYHEWSVSAHAYASISPMFHKFEQKLNDLSQGTVGYFCMRCHAPVATSLGASRAEPLWNLPEVAREGVTCIACHRVKYVYGKSNGERRIEEGDIFAPVFGGLGGDGVAETIHRKEHFKVKTSPAEQGPGQEIHVAGIYFDPLTKSEFCAPCHQVAVHPGIKLEVVWEQYRASPACKKGIQCQDCHMGRVPGLPQGYNFGPVAKMAGKTVNDQRKRSNHVFYGPNYSIAHPGVFPFHLKANRWTMEQWLAFDWRAGWGTEAFEKQLASGQIQVAFPECWKEVDDRYDAREIIDDNIKKLVGKRETRLEIMENGSHVEGPFFTSTPRCGQDVEFDFIVTNTNEGHNLLTASLGAQPQLWANIVLMGPDGRRLWETGYTDSYGDLANIHSVDVRNGRVPYDWQLFNLQTMFLITGVKGTDREFFIPVNVDIDQLPFIRPGVQPISVINHPPFIRMESQSLSPLGSRKVPYRIPGELIRQPGKYRLSFRMRSRAEPPYFMRFCEATLDMQRAMNEWMIDVHPMSVEFYVQ